MDADVVSSSVEQHSSDDRVPTFQSTLICNSDLPSRNFIIFGDGDL